MDVLLGVAFLLALLGAMFLAHGLAGRFRARRIAREVAGWTSAEAVVLGRRDGPRRRAADPAVQFHEVRFRDPTGAEHTGVTRDASLVVLPPGTPVSVRYDPADPERVTLGDGRRAGGPELLSSVALTAVGAGLLLAGVVLLALATR